MVALDAGATIAVPRRSNVSYVAGGRVAVMLRPEDISVRTTPGAAVAVSLSGTVAEIGYQGDSCRLSVAVGGEAVKVKVPPHLALALQPGWTSRDIASPVSLLIVNGVLFTASSGTKAVPSVLYAIDASNGKDLWNSMRTITTSVRGGLSAGQGNVYVPGADSTLYAFGFAIEK